MTEVVIRKDNRPPIVEKADGLVGIVIEETEDKGSHIRLSNGDYIYGDDCWFDDLDSEAATTFRQDIIARNEGALEHYLELVRTGLNLELDLALIHSDFQEVDGEVQRSVHYITELSCPYTVIKPIPVVIVEFAEEDDTSFVARNPNLEHIGLHSPYCTDTLDDALSFFSSLLVDTLDDSVIRETDYNPAAIVLFREYVEVQLIDTAELDKYVAEVKATRAKIDEEVNKYETYPATIRVPSFQRSFPVDVLEKLAYQDVAMYFSEARVFAQGVSFEDCNRQFGIELHKQLVDLRQINNRTPKQQSKLELLASYKSNVKLVA